MIKVKSVQCGKYGYFTKQDAEKRMESFSGKKRKRCSAIYRCPICGMFHLTSKKQEKNRETSKRI